MSNINWSELNRDCLLYAFIPVEGVKIYFESGKASAARQMHQNAVTFFSHAIAEVEHPLLSILHAHRAAAYKNCGEYGRAMEDAERAIQLSPNLPDGYVQAADVLLREGKDGKALVHLNKMLNSVSNMHMPYKILYTWRQVLKRRVEQRNNHVFERLPYDILNRIFSYLSFKDCVRSAATCRSWRHFFDDWSPMYRHVTLTFALCRHIRRALKAAKIQESLRIVDMDGLYLETGIALNSLVTAGCSRIESVSTVTEHRREVVSRVPRLFTSLYSLIKQNSHHLSRLLLHLNHVGVFLVAASALDVCPNLIELVVAPCDRRGPQFEKPEWPNRRFRLQRLFLRGEYFMATEIHGLLRCCPDLRCLGLHYPDTSDHIAVLSAIYDCCPQLEWLSYVDDTREVLCDPFKDWSKYVVKNSGLRDFHLTYQAWTSPDPVIRQFFQRHHHTLKSIRINPRLTEPATESLNTLAAVGAPCLISFRPTDKERTLQAGAEEVGRAVASLMKNAPVLREVQLDGVDLRGWDDAFVNMANLRCLEEIELVCCRHLPKRGLSHLFEKSPSLQRLHFRDRDARRFDLSVVMEALSTKQPPVVSLTCDRLDDDTIADALSQWKNGSTVERLRISSRGRITRKTLLLLATFPSLKCLVLDVDHITQADLCEYLRARPDSAKVIFEPTLREIYFQGTYVREADGPICFIAFEYHY